jgi:hypothetical protein
MSKNAWWRLSPGELIIIVLALLALGLAALATAGPFDRLHA